MKWCVLAALLILGSLASAAGRPAGKNHEFRGDRLMSAPPGANPGWKPTVILKVNDSVAVGYGVALKDVDVFECSSSHGEVRVSLSMDATGKGVNVGIRSGGRNERGKKATATVRWVITDMTGRDHQGFMVVVFEE